MYIKNSLKSSLNRAAVAFVAVLFLGITSLSALALESVNGLNFNGYQAVKDTPQTSAATVSDNSVYISYGIDLSQFIPVSEEFKFLTVGFVLDLDKTIDPIDGFDTASNFNASPFLSLGENMRTFDTYKVEYSSNNAGFRERSYLAKLGGSLKVLDKLDPYNYSDQDLSIDFIAGMNLSYNPLTVYVGTTWKPLNFIALRTGIEEEVAANDLGMLDARSTLCGGIAYNYNDINFGYSYKSNSDNTSHSFSVSVSPDFLTGIAHKQQPVTYASL